MFGCYNEISWNLRWTTAEMYVVGLKPFIHNELKLWRPKTIVEAKQTTKIIEQNKIHEASFRALEKSNKYSDVNSIKYST